MTKKNTIYAPGELDQVRKKLGDIDGQEAQRMAQLLGGEVGSERSEEPKPILNRKARPIQRKAVVSNGRAHESRSLPEEEAAKSAPKQNQAGSFVPVVVIPYRERVKMDKYAGDPVFEIKNFFQVFYSIISIFGEIPDKVNPLFVDRRMNDYYKKIETLVTTTRTLLPRNNLRRNEQIKRNSVFAFAILDVIRRWNLEQIASDLAKIQSHPRKVLVVEFADILRAIYKPLFLLEQLEMEAHIKNAYKLLYKILYLEDPMEAKEKYQELIRVSLSSLMSIRREIRFRMYPLLLKLLSERFLPYEQFFTELKDPFMAFIGAREEDRISPALADFENELQAGKTDEEGAEGEEAEEKVEEEAKSDEAEEKKEKSPAESEKKAVERGLQVLEKLFPKAGWEKISSFPDFYPYFSDIFNLKKNYELIAPTDSLQQVAILMRVLEELFFGLRSIKFRAISESGVYSETSGDVLGTILNKWNRDVELSIDDEYLPRLTEYCRILDSSVESRTSSYAKRLLNELHWIKRLYFFPYYKFESFYPPPFKKNEVDALYPEIRQMRKYLTVVAAGIEQGNRLGGAEKKAPCDGINNPWEPYVFQVSNPLSVRLDALLKNPKQRNNASLVFFSLAVVTVLDHIVNDETSWAYADRPGPLFRSINGEGMQPVYGVEHKINTTALFDESIKKEG
jgi:hypothetical protein